MIFFEMAVVLLIGVVTASGYWTLAHLKRVQAHGPGCRPCRIIRSVPGVLPRPRG